MLTLKRNRFWQHSRIYRYVRTRQLEGTLALGPKHGAFIINANRVLAGCGNISEKRWPYPKDSKWPVLEPPGLDAIARFNKIFAYFRIRDLEDARRCLTNGSSFSLSLPIHSGWSKAPKGMISLPNPGQPFTQNHCINAAGYDDTEQLLRFANSWGVSWGDAGYGYLPYDYFARFLQDAWFLQPPFIGCR